MASKSVLCMIQMPASAPEADVKTVKIAIALATFTTYGGFILNVIESMITASRPNAEEMSNTNQDQRQAVMWGIISLVFSLGCTTGCFCCFWAGLKSKNQSLLRVFAGCMFFSAILQLIFTMVIGPINRTRQEKLCKQCIEKNSSRCMQPSPGGRGPDVALNTRDCGFYGNRDYGFSMALGVIFILFQIAAGTLTLNLSEKMNYFFTSKMDQFKAQQGQVQIVGTSGATIVSSGQPTIVSSGQPTIVSSGQPTIVSSGQPTIISSGQPTIISSGQPTIVKT